MIERLRAYRARLVKAGRLIEARAVARCIELVKARQRQANRQHNRTSQYLLTPEISSSGKDATID